jgi:hypothetical protein
MRGVKFCLVAVAAAASSLVTGRADAAFTAFDTFNAYNPGPLSGQGGWTTSPTVGAVTNVVDAGGGGDREVQVYGNSIPNHKGLGALSIPNASTAATVYANFRMAAATTGNNFNFVVTDAAAPADTAGSSEVQFNFDAGQAPAGGTTTFRARSGGAFVFLSTGGTVATRVEPVAGAVYNLWFVIDNSTDKYRVYAQSDAVPALAAPTQLLATDGTGGDFTFRNGAAANDLVTVNFGNGATAAANAVTFDDVYVDLSGQNLANPVPEPAALGLLGVGAASLIGRRRTRRA